MSRSAYCYCVTPRLPSSELCKIVPVVCLLPVLKGMALTEFTVVMYFDVSQSAVCRSVVVNNISQLRLIFSTFVSIDNRIGFLAENLQAGRKTGNIFIESASVD